MCVHDVDDTRAAGLTLSKMGYDAGLAHKISTPPHRALLSACPFPPCLGSLLLAPRRFQTCRTAPLRSIRSND
jgi:hypothetical protein